MKERKNGINPLMSLIDALIEGGAEVHLIDQSDPSEIVEHVYIAKPEEVDEIEEEIPFMEDDICPYDGDCNDCPCETECAEDLGLDLPGYYDDDFEPDMWGIPDIARIVFSGRATIVFWEDGTKTVVKCSENEEYERYAGFAAACMKKMFGSTTRAKAIMDECAVEQVVEKKKKTDDRMDAVETQVACAPVMDPSIQEAINEALAK